MIKILGVVGIFLSSFSTDRVTIDIKLISGLKTDTNKTVAIYSSTKSYFKDYSIDTLVSILNKLNTKSNIIYCKNTEDHSKTGFYADYVVDLIFLLKYSQWVAPTSEMVPVTKTIPVRVLQPNGSYEWVDQQVTVMEVKDSKEYTKPAEGEIRIKITEKSKNEKVTRKTISSVNNSESDLKLKLILQLEIYLIEQFSK